MTKKNVVKSTVVTPNADKLIEKMAAILDLHDVKLNGDNGVTASSFMGAVFENIIKSEDKEAKLQSLLSNYFDLHDKNGEPNEPGKLKSYINEAFAV